MKEDQEFHIPVQVIERYQMRKANGPRLLLIVIILFGICLAIGIGAALLLERVV